MDTEREEIPIHTNSEEPLLDEASEENILGAEGVDVGVGVGEEVELSSELSDDIGTYNILSDEIDDIQSSYDIGNTIIFLLKDKNAPFLGTITEILSKENLLKCKDEKEKEFIFLFEGGEIIMNTENYEILDMIKVKIHKPLEESDDYQEIDFDSEILIDKIYSELAKRNDLLSSMIHSMNIYDKFYKIKRVEKIIDIFLEMIDYKEKIINLIPDYMIPIIDDNLKIIKNILIII